MASSTTIPRRKNKGDITSIFIVNPIQGRIMKAIAIDKGTENATKRAFTRPIKNIRTIVTKNKTKDNCIIKLI